MSVATVRPDETLAVGGSSVVGAASQHAATNDDSDSSYISLMGSNSTLGFVEPTIPSGGSLVEVRVRTRVAIVGGISTYFVRAGDEDAKNVVTWASPTTATAAVWPADTFNVADVELAIEKTAGSGEIRVYELYIDFHYAVQLTVDVTAPTGTLTETNLPTVTWDRTFDSAGGSPTHFEVKVFNDAQYLAGGFDPDTSEPFAESGEIASSATSWSFEDPILPNDDYRAYVRIAQTISGELHWSEWDFEAFTMDTDAPGDPVLALTPQPDCGRMRIDLDNTAGAIATEGYQVQRSDDGGVAWADIRTVDGEGLVTDLDGGGAAIATDAEAPNGTAAQYRARAVHHFATGDSYSGWSTDTDTRTSTDAWLKHPYDPTLNMVVTVYSQPEEGDASRVGVHNVLGRPDPIITSDTPGPTTGELVFDHTTAAQQAAFDALRSSVSPLLLQMPVEHHWPDRWIVFTGERRRARHVDKLEVEDRLDSVPWTKVARPSGNLLAWPDPACP